MALRWSRKRCAPPGRPLIARTIAGAAVPALFAFAYIAMIAGSWFWGEGGYSSLDGVASLFANRWLLLAGWTHYLAFDLLVGVWEVHDSRDRRSGRMAALSTHQNVGSQESIVGSRCGVWTRDSRLSTTDY